MGPLIALGYNKTLDLEDVPQLDNYDSANVVFARFINKLEYDGNGSQASTLKLVKALILSIWKEILWTALLSIICTSASYVGPYLIDVFVQYLNSHHQTKYKGYALVFIFFLSKLIRCISERHLFFQLRMISIRVRAALFAIIYKKSLRLSTLSKQGHSSGENANVLNVDVERTSLFSWYLHNIWRVPVQVVLALLILYKSIGLASLVAFVSTMILLLANVPLGKLQEKFQGELMDSKDRRMKVTSEALRNMRILKLQGWDMKFLNQIIKLRNFESRRLKKLLYSSAMIAFVYLSTPMFVSMVTFGFCVLIGIPLESGKILSALAIFEILQGTIYNLPKLIYMVVQTKVSLDRISSFLCLDDLHTNIVQKLPRDNVEVSVEIVKGNFSWDLHSSNLTLKDINFRVYHGTRVAICGFVGSGKSSLLSCILGEVPKISGSIKLNGTKAYVAQSPWIQSGKIVDNILFGKEMDKERYNMILEACSLKKDLELFAFGDQTIIGERGINLSGGQKQRIQIARALYHDADIYLLDDPFSAVDAHTGTHLFKECLLGILGSKTVIYVTHQVEFLPSADLILVMRDGKITQAGKYEEIHSSGTDFMELVGSHKKGLAVINSVERQTALNSLIIDEEDANILCSEKLIKDDQDSEPKNYKTEKSNQSEGQLVQEEKREKGGVGLSIYWKYVTAAYKGAFVPLILLAQFFFQFLLIFSNYWMVSATPVSVDVIPYVRGTTVIFVYVALTLGSSLCVLIRSMLIATVGYKTATLFFNKMHLCIFRAPMSFFDSTPSGRILNRASIDQSALDTSIPNQIEEFLMSLIEFLGTTIVMSQVAWQMLLLFIPMGVICIWYQVRYAPHLPLVLRGLTCTFPGGMKIGIVGRTGSGKSTLVQALFRMVEPEVGQIWIDGINISNIGLHDLRSRLSIIPQDPTMFEGSLRSNLDPLEEYTDEQIWEALNKCQLSDEVRKKEGKLDSAVTENGENWSMGQRQLVCLGRALLKKNKVLVLDEATASVDTMTDYLIQQTLNQEFSGSTIITIAHRITSILDIDLVLLLDNGLVLEYDSPAKLLEIKTSSFAKLVNEYTQRFS
ncbi:ABC transporter C family member 3-like isoform X4 [Telopea speciosissima]|uniref:ABC transporter C family member 3-like isoform X4 n=1 Tax=Telopea speciosissima TaxID=54955 RepID=UPI001CC5B702|nr:ABC transporter C family member 3-like isoform X4 [Telopea speciosissima]